MMRDRNKETKVRNFFYLLAYAFEYDKLKFKEQKMFDTEEFKNIYDFFSVLLCTCIEDILKEGAYNEYINYNEELNCIKGRIDVVSTIRTNIMRTENKVICNYDEYSINNLLNQIIKTTLFYLLKTNVVDSIKISLRQLFYNFENIEIIKDKKNIPWNNIRYNILNIRYKPVINICKYILNDLIINSENAKEEFQMIDDDQVYHQLFEKFIKNYLKRYYKDYRTEVVKDIYIDSKMITWQTESEIQNSKIPKMHTDVTIERGSKEKIIDAKFYGHIISSIGFRGYKTKDKGTLNSNNWYQIFSYIINEQERLHRLDSKNEKLVTSGMLIYAKTEEDNLGDFELDEPIMGHRIQVKIIDLTQEFGDPYDVKENTIAFNMNNIAEEILKELED